MLIICLLIIFLYNFLFFCVLFTEKFRHKTYPPNIHPTAGDLPGDGSLSGSGIPFLLRCGYLSDFRNGCQNGCASLLHIIQDKQSFCNRIREILSFPLKKLIIFLNTGQKRMKTKMRGLFENPMPEGVKRTKGQGLGLKKENLNDSHQVRTNFTTAP